MKLSTQLIKMELKSRESFFESNVFMFTPDTAEGEGEPKVAINCGHKSTSKGWQLTLPPDTTEVHTHTRTHVRLIASVIGTVSLHVHKRFNTHHTTTQYCSIYRSATYVYNPIRYNTGVQQELCTCIYRA